MCTSRNYEGAPIAEEGISAAILEKHGDLERITSWLKLIENHQEFVLLKNCFLLPKLQYNLRASPVHGRGSDLEEFDKTLVCVLLTVTNVQIESEGLKQAVL